MFAAEQTWPTEEEMRRGRKVSMDQEAMGEMESETLEMAKIKPAQGDQSKDLAGLFDKMQIAVVGRETGAQNDSGSEFMESVRPKSPSRRF